jgi:hypothetical protein
MSPSYLRLKEQVAAVLYVRNRIKGEVLQLGAALASADAHEREARRAELARAAEDLAMAERDACAAREHLLAELTGLRAELRQRLRARASEIVTALEADREVERAIRT